MDTDTAPAASKLLPPITRRVTPTAALREAELTITGMDRIVPNTAGTDEIPNTVTRAETTCPASDAGTAAVVATSCDKLLTCTLVTVNGVPSVDTRLTTGVPAAANAVPVIVQDDDPTATLAMAESTVGTGRTVPMTTPEPLLIPYTVTSADRV